MARLITKGLIGQQDLSIGGGTFTRSTSTGGTQTLNKISGLAAIIGTSVDQVASANINPITILNLAPSTGLYLVSFAIATTQVATISSTRPYIVLSWTNGDNSLSVNVKAVGPDSNNSLTAVPDYANVNIYVQSGTPVAFATLGFVSNGVTGLQYAVHCRMFGPF